MIAGDHHRPDTRLAALLYRPLSFRPQRVFHRHQPEEYQLLLDETGRLVERLHAKTPPRHPEHP